MTSSTSGEPACLQSKLATNSSRNNHDSTVFGIVNGNGDGDGRLRRAEVGRDREESAGNPDVSEYAAASEFQPRRITKTSVANDETNVMETLQNQKRRADTIATATATDFERTSIQKRCSCVPNWSSFVESQCSPLLSDSNSSQTQTNIMSTASWNQCRNRQNALRVLLPSAEDPDANANADVYVDVPIDHAKDSNCVKTDNEPIFATVRKKHEFSAPSRMYVSYNEGVPVPIETGAYYPEVQGRSRMLSLHSMQTTRSLPQEAFGFSFGFGAKQRSPSDKPLGCNKQRATADCHMATTSNLTKSPSSTPLTLVQSQSQSQRAAYEVEIEQLCSSSKLPSQSQSQSQRREDCAIHPFLEATLVAFFFDNRVHRWQKLLLVVSLFLLAVVALVQIHNRFVFYQSHLAHSQSQSLSRQAAEVLANGKLKADSLPLSMPTPMPMPPVTFCFDNPFSGAYTALFDHKRPLEDAQIDANVNGNANVNVNVSARNWTPSAIDVLTSCADRLAVSSFESIAAAMLGELNNASARELATFGRLPSSLFLRAAAHRKEDVLLT